jgi:hypothetical protein
VEDRLLFFADLTPFNSYCFTVLATLSVVTSFLALLIRQFYRIYTAIEAKWLEKNKEFQGHGSSFSSYSYIYLLTCKINVFFIIHYCGTDGHL